MFLLAANTSWFADRKKVARLASLRCVGLHAATHDKTTQLQHAKKNPRHPPGTKKHLKRRKRHPEKQKSMAGGDLSFCFVLFAASRYMMMRHGTNRALRTMNGEAKQSAVHTNHNNTPTTTKKGQIKCSRQPTVVHGGTIGRERGGATCSPVPPAT